MRKQFDIEVVSLSNKVAELEHRLNSLTLEKKEESQKSISQVDMSSMMLLRESKEKEKYSLFSEEEKKKLQRIIDAKDLEI